MNLDEARAREKALRQQLAVLVTRRAEAARAADELDQRQALPGAPPELAATARRQRALAGQLDAEVASTRAQLREQEATVARLRADALGAPSDQPSEG